MKILVINAGSSSLKYQLLNMEDESVIAKVSASVKDGAVSVGVTEKSGKERKLEIKL